MSAQRDDFHETMVRTYRGTDRFQKDAKRLAKDGWSVSNTVSQRPRAGCGRILSLGLFTLIFPPKPELVVTYTRIAARRG